MNEQRLIDTREINAEHLSYESPSSIRDMIRGIPTIDPETLPIVQELRAKLAECEPKHGHWIPCEDLWGNIDPWECSCCGCDWTCIDGTPADNNMKYCPECGAKMDEER